MPVFFFTSCPSPLGNAMKRKCHSSYSCHVSFDTGIVAGNGPPAPNSYNHVDNKMGEVIFCHILFALIILLKLLVFLQWLHTLHALHIFVTTCRFLFMAIKPHPLFYQVDSWAITRLSPLVIRTPQSPMVPQLQCILQCSLPHSLTVRHHSHTHR